MANNCDDTYQQIAELQARRDALLNAQYTLYSVKDPTDGPSTGDGSADGKRRPPVQGPAEPPVQGPAVPDPARQFVTRDPATGEPIEADMSQLDPATFELDMAAYRGEGVAAVDGNFKPLGRDGQFEGLKRLVDHAGQGGAADIYALTRAAVGKWEEINPEDFKRVIAVNSAETVAQRVADAFAEGTARADMGLLTQAVMRDAAPFVNLLNKQTRVLVMDVVARDNLLDKMAAITDHIERTGLPPTEDMLRELRNTSTTAVFTYRSSAMVRRVSGQLLQQLQNNYQSVAPGLVGKMLEDGLRKEFNDVYNRGSNLILDDTLAGEALQAASLGMEGVRDLKDLMERIRQWGADGKVSPEKDWRSTLRIQARMYYKDSQLFNMSTQAVSNYLSSKAVYWYEGWKSANYTASEFFFDRQAGRANDRGPVNVGTDLVRDLLGSAWDSIRAHQIIGDMTDDVGRIAMREALADTMPPGLVRNYQNKWRQLIQKGVMEGRNPFGDAVQDGLNIDIATGATRTRQEEYSIANKVLYGEKGVPSDPNNLIGSAAMNAREEMRVAPAEIPFILRDRLHLSTKIVMNHLLEGLIKAKTGKDVRLPLTSSLQTLAAVDSRSGMKVYLSLRGKSLMMETFQREPDIRKLSFEDRKAEVQQKLEAEIYRADPSEAQIKAYREQFGDAGSTDQEIRARIISRHLGAPVLDSPDKLAALEESRRLRMQTVPDQKWVKDFDRWVQNLRENSYVDAAIPYWRSGASGAAYVMGELWEPGANMANLVLKSHLKVMRKIEPGETDTVLRAKAFAGLAIYAQVVGAVAGLRALGEGVLTSGPAEGADPAQWRLRYHSNALMNVTGLGGIPLVGIVLTINSLFDAADAAQLSKYDKINTFQALGTAFLGQIYRGSGFGQVRELVDTVASGDPRRLQDWVSFMVSGQVNPGSGVMRQLERGVGLFQAGTGLNERYTDTWHNGSDNALVDRMRLAGGELQQRAEDLPGYDSLQQVWSLLRNLTGTTSDRPLKKVDYLGRELRTPSGWFQYEYPTGFPGVYDGRVHNTLLQIGMLRPPSALVTGRLDGLPMTAELKDEYTQKLAQAEGGRISRDSRYSGKVFYRIQGGRYDEETGEVKKYERSLPLGNLMDSLTEGRDLHGALNALFRSETWQEWMKDPSTTLVPSLSRNPVMADAPRADLTQRIPAVVVRLLHEYYGDLALDAVEASGTEAAAEWRSLRDARRQLLAPPAEVKERYRNLRSLVGPIGN